MKILFITRKFPPSVGGMQNYAYDLYCWLDKEADVKLIKWGGSNMYLPVVLPYFFVRACWLLATSDIDIVHVQDGVLAPLGFSLSRLFRKPFSIVLHGLDITYNNGLFQAIVPPLVRRAAIVFCISQAAADEATKRGVDKKKALVAPLGITDDKRLPRASARKELEQQLKIDAASPVLLTVGRLVERKGVAWFVENALPDLVKKYPNLVYLVVGSGEQEAKIRGAVATHKLGSHIKMLGKVPETMLPMLYHGADVFVQPNIQVPNDIEGFGRILLEASLCELPVVAAGIEGIKDAIESDKNGILVESKNTKAFVREIGSFVANPKAARSFGAKSRQYTLKHFRWDVIVQIYLKGYTDILEA